MKNYLSFYITFFQALGLGQELKPKITLWKGYGYIIFFLIDLLASLVTLKDALTLWALIMHKIRVVQSLIKLTQGWPEFWFQFYNFLEKCSVYIVCPSVVSCSNLKLHQNKKT